MSNPRDFFQLGGNLSEDAPSYIERPADQELFTAIENRDLCLVLAPRQTGKSSLMVHSLSRLKEKKIFPAVVDLAPLGSHSDPNSWYSDVIYQIERSLKIETDSQEWWETNKRLGTTQRFMTFLENIILEECKDDVVIFFDEIDSVLKLPFSDDFFITIRSLYNLRATRPALRRLNFVLLGVATPSSFIKDRTRTPFNIGVLIELNDFDKKGVAAFKKVLGFNSGKLIDRIFFWTNGQPLLVQKIAAAVYSLPKKMRTWGRIDEEVLDNLLNRKIEKDTHLTFIQDYLLDGSSNVREILKIYQKVLEKKEIEADDQSTVQNRLKLAGVIRIKDGKLLPRNQIYEKIFDLKWIRENTPCDIQKLEDIISRIEKTYNENMHYLDLFSNQLTTLPDSIGKLKNLKDLTLYNNQLSTLPETIGQLKNLRELDLNNNQLNSLPEAIGNLTNLRELNLDNNQITTLPESIVNLANLTEIYLNNNQLATLPEDIDKLKNLRELHLNNNQLFTLPRAFSNLTNLVKLDLKNNKFKVDIDIYDLAPKEQIEIILGLQKSEKFESLQPIHEAKVIFIGESNSGKTHLIELLCNEVIKREIKTTHGIERNRIIIPHKDKDIRLNIWDLGGQEFMRGIHQFFFSERALYVLVTVARREREELNYWLKLANQLGNKAPVLVVINKIDLDPHDLDRKSLERDYPNIIGFVRTCIYDCVDCKSSETIELLKNKIKATVSDKDLMPGVFEQRPLEWFAIKEKLEKMEAIGTDFITFKEYENLEFIKDLPEEERRNNLKLLSMTGAVVSFVDDPHLIDTNVINPQWIMDGVYAITNDPIVKDKSKGKLHIIDLERILPKGKFSRDSHAYLLELMKKFNLCYASKEQRDVYFIPDLFEDIEPDFEWDSEKSIHFRYNYDDFPPDAFMTRFIVEMSQDIQDEKRWRSGVYISNGSCHAKVYQTYRKNYIHIEVLGNKGEGRSYLYTIRETFRKLHKPFPQMQIKQEVLYKNCWLDYTLLSMLEDKRKPYYHVELDEDLPVTDILNGYSTPIDRDGSQKHIKIFLASSSELKDEREQFEIFIHRENKYLYKKGIFIELIIWDDFIDVMSQTRLQDEYNRAVKHSDIFVSLFFTKVGKYTLKEFETAFGQFKINDKPLIYIYFKDAPINTEKIADKIQSLLQFRKRLRELGHFGTIFKNIDDLKFQFKNQLEKVLLEL